MLVPKQRFKQWSSALNWLMQILSVHLISLLLNTTDLRVRSKFLTVTTHWNCTIVKKASRAKPWLMLNVPGLSTQSQKSIFLCLVCNHIIWHHWINIEALVLTHKTLVPLAQNLTVQIDKRVTQVVYWLSICNFSCSLI
jgi:hypothetical protein